MAKYVIAGGDKNGQQFAPDSQIQVFYAQTGSLNVANNTITYGNWQWDQTAGDSTTPGFKVISGSWSLPKEAGQTWQVNVPIAITVPAGLTYDFANGIPAESGVYVINLTPESIIALEKANPNYKLNISSKAKFTLDATLTIEFEDTQEGNKQVGQIITKSGVAGSTVDNLDLKLPENYELAPDQELPTSYTFGKALSQNLYIKLVHKTAIVDPTDSATNPTKDESWFKKNDLVKDVTRTINYEGLSEEQLAQISEDQKKQTVEFTRTAVYDLVTGKLVANSEGQWTAVDGKDTFAGFTPKEFAGYTTNPNKVEQVKVTGNDKDSEVTVTYTVNTQTGKISYVDSDGKEVGQTPLSGKTGETVDVNPQVPAGWKIVSGQDIPKTVVATADGIPTVTVRVEHDTIIVTPETPPRDIPTGPVPGDPSKNYDHLGTLTKIPTRIITVITPSGAKLIITQKVTFTRTATFDKVTGKVTYSEWKVDGNTQWDAYTAPTFSGYTASQSKVAAEKVSVDTADSNIKITYKQDEVPTPEPEPQPKPKPNPEPKPDKPDKPNKSDKPNKLAKPDKPAKQKESN